MPAKSDLLQAILERVERNDKNEGNYEHFLKLLNWRDSPGGKIALLPREGWGESHVVIKEGENRKYYS